jgi:transposase
LLSCLRNAAAHPGEVVLVFLDEMGYYRWSVAGRTWAASAPDPAPLADRAGPNNKQWRLIGALNALSGRVDYLDGYIIGRAKLIVFYRQLVAAYGDARLIYVVQDNWSIHRHPEVQDALAALPQIEPVWLPTYAPWLNPIEKLWRWLREQVLTLHRLAGDWDALRERVNAFLDQFAEQSQVLLHYVGLNGEGKLAQALDSS